MRFSVSVLIAGGMLLGAPAHAQQYATVARRPVTIWATVRDHHGDLVPNLTKDDFELNEDGIRQTIDTFSAQCDLPLTVGLLLDTSPAQQRLLDKARAATMGFISNMVRESSDTGFLIRYDKDVELFKGLTSSADTLESSLGTLTGPGAVPASSNGGKKWHGAALYDAVFLASNDVLKQQQGRKVLVVLSDGVDHGSKETLENAIWAAQRADAVVYSVLLEDDDELYANAQPLGWEMSHRQRVRRQAQPQVDGEEVLRVISEETGGRMFEVSWRHSAEQIYGRIEEELRNQYSITYVPDREYIGPGYHKINLTTRRNDLTVQSRDGYYAWR